jgi:putative FmdB family regulatory protein
VPTYEYACTECGDRLEVVQRFSDDPLTVCAACGGRLRKVFSPVGIVFKGSGFYRTDSRTSTATAGANGNGKAGADGADSKSETAPKTESGAKAESKSSGSSDGGTSKSEKAPASKGTSGTGSKVA